MCLTFTRDTQPPHCKCPGPANTHRRKCVYRAHNQEKNYSTEKKSIKRKDKKTYKWYSHKNKTRNTSGDQQVRKGRRKVSGDGLFETSQALRNNEVEEDTQMSLGLDTEPQSLAETVDLRVQREGAVTAEKPDLTDPRDSMKVKQNCTKQTITLLKT